MNFVKICTPVLSSGKKLLFVLLLAGCILSTKAQTTSHGQPESISHSDVSLFFMKNYKYFTADQRLEFIHKIGSMADDPAGASPLSSPAKHLRGIGGYAKSSNTLAMQQLSTEETNDPPVSATDLMEEAIKASEEAVKYLKDLTTDVIDRAREVKEEIAEWKDKISGMTEQSLEEYIVSVVQATVTLNNASVEGRNMMQDMLDLVSLTIMNMEMFIDDDEALKEAVVNAQIVMGVQMELTAMRLGELEIKVTEAQADFQVAADMSESFSQIIADNLNNKDGYIDKKADSMRAEAYGGCAACLIMPWTCPICYSVAAGVVETQINEMKEDLRSTKNALRSIKDQFDALKVKCTELGNAAAAEYTNMNNVKVGLESTQRLVVATDSLTFWRGIVLPRLTSLRDLLEETLATTLEG